MPIHRYTEEEAREAGLLDVDEVAAAPAARAAAPAVGGSAGTPSGAGRTTAATTRCSMPSPASDDLLERVRE